MERTGRRVKVKVKVSYKGIIPYLITFFMTMGIILLGMFFAGILPGGAYSTVNTDTMDQMASISAMLARHIKNGESLFYSWETSMGQNTALLYAFCAFSPFTLLYLIIPDVYSATIAGLVLKLALSALLFHLFLDKGMGWKSRWNSFFSMCYGLCGFQMEYMLSTNLMDGLYLLPLVMYCLVRAIDKKRFILLTIVYALSFIIQFYCGFLSGIFSFSALVCILYLREGKDFIRNNVRFFLRYALCVTTAVLMSLCVLVPAISFFKSSTGFNTVMVRGLIQPFDILYSLYFGRPTSLITDIPFLYCGMPVLLLLPLYFACGNIRKKEKIVMGVVLGSILITLYVDPVYYFLHAFNRPDGFTVRYAYLYVFVMVMLAARYAYVMKEKEKKPEKGKLVLYMLIQLLAAAAVILLHEFFGEKADGKGVIYGLVGSMILLAAWGVLLLVMRRWKDKRCIVAAYVLLAAELTGQCWFNCLEQGRVPSKDTEAWNEQMKMFICDMENDSNGTVQPFRAHAANAPYANQSAMYGYMGIGQFASSNYTDLYRLMSRLGDAVSGVRYTQTGATDATDMIFGVKYRMRMRRADEKREAFTEVYKRALPLGFMVSSSILAPEEFDGNVFENQNRLISAMCGYDIQVYKQSEYLAYEENNAVYEKDGNTHRIRTLEQGVMGDVLFGIPESGYKHAYSYFQLIPYSGGPREVELPNTMAMDIAAFSPDDRKSSGARFENVLGNAIMEMSRDGNAFLLRVADYDPPDKSFEYAEHYFCYQDELALDQAYECLEKGNFRVIEFGEGRIKAEVDVVKEKPMLFFSIPKDDGWEAYVDGQRRELIPVIMNAFMALPLEEGHHEITLLYEAPGEIPGRLLSLLGVMILLGTCLAEGRKSSFS